jgi:uncharacterized DUF497 family protein
MREIIEAVSPLLPEHWERVETPYGPINVGWTVDKEAANPGKHDGLRLRDGIPVIANPDNRFVVQTDEQGQEVDKVVGYGESNVLLVVICQWVHDDEAEPAEEPAARLISVWKATPNDIREVGMNEDTTPKLKAKPVQQAGRWGDRIAAKIKQQKEKRQAYLARQAAANGDQPPKNKKLAGN